MTRAVAWVVIALFSVVRWREHEWTAPRRRNDLRAIAILLAFGFALALYMRERGWNLAFNPEQTPVDRGDAGALPPGLDAGSDPGYQFQFAWLPMVAALFLGALGVAAFVLANRRVGSSAAKAELAAELALTLDLSLDDLRAETDPRRAVIAAYARLGFREYCRLGEWVAYRRAGGWDLIRPLRAALRWSWPRVDRQP